MRSIEHHAPETLPCFPAPKAYHPPIPPYPPLTQLRGAVFPEGEPKIREQDCLSATKYIPQSESVCPGDCGFDRFNGSQKCACELARSHDYYTLDDLHGLAQLMSQNNVVGDFSRYTPPGSLHGCSPQALEDAAHVHDRGTQPYEAVYALQPYTDVEHQKCQDKPNEATNSCNYSLPKSVTHSLIHSGQSTEAATERICNKSRAAQQACRSVLSDRTLKSYRSRLDRKFSPLREPRSYCECIKSRYAAGFARHASHKMSSVQKVVFIAGSRSRGRKAELSSCEPDEQLNLQQNVLDAEVADVDFDEFDDFDLALLHEYRSQIQCQQPHLQSSNVDLECCSEHEHTANLCFPEVKHRSRALFHYSVRNLWPPPEFELQGDTTSELSTTVPFRPFAQPHYLA